MTIDRYVYPYVLERLRLDKIGATVVIPKTKPTVAINEIEAKRVSVCTDPSE